MRRHVISLAITFVATLAWSLAGAVGVVAAGGEQILSFDSQVHIDRLNAADILESIQYDFGSSSHHGIYRTVPIDYTDADNKTYKIQFKYVSTIDENGAVVPAKLSVQKGSMQIRLGDANQTVTGIHTYKIHYKLTPIVNQKDGRDHLALDITGNGWEVPILKTTASLTVGDPAVFSDSRCYTGPAGSTSTAGCVMTGMGNVASPLELSYNQTLAPGDGMTYEGYLPNGYVNHYLAAGQSRPQTASERLANIGKAAAIAVAVLSLLLVFIVLAIRALRQHHRKSGQVIVAQYEAPDGLTPGEIGYLHDNTASTVEVTATLIDLAVRGYLQIVQTAPKKLLQKAQYDLLMIKPLEGLLDYEQTLTSAIFTTSNRVAVSSLDAAAMAAVVAKMGAQLKARLAARNYYGTYAAEKGLMAKIMESGNMSDVGAAEWAKVEGLKLYLSVVEKDRLKFTDAPEKTPERFNKLLPYAVALGVEKDWAKQFEGIDVASGATWYVGSPGLQWTALALASDLNSGFASAVSSNFVAPSGGGGMSGGGFGGGGGGSW